MKPNPKAIMISGLIKEQLEFLKEGADYSHFSTFLERRKLLTRIYDSLFPKVNFVEFASANRKWNNKYENISVSFVTPDFSIQKEEFMDVSPMNLQCRLEENGEIYTLSLPLHRHNVEAYLVGLLTTNKDPLFLTYLDASLTVKGFLSPDSYKWMTKEEGFLDSLYPEEYGWVNKLATACFSALEELNILHLQSAIMNSRTTIPMSDLELLNRWSHYYVRFYEDFIQDPHSVQNSLYNFEDFVSWSMLTGYTAGMKLSLINKKNGFSPDNLQWVKETAIKQPNGFIAKTKKPKKDTSDSITIEKREQTVEEWSSESGIPVDTLIMRDKYGWKGTELLRQIREKASVDTHYKNQLFRIKGEIKTLNEWSKKLRIPVSVLTGRIKSGVEEEELVLPYKGSRTS